MAKENTHLFFAHTILEHLGDMDITRDISKHIDYYYLGSIIPDTFYYSSDRSVEVVSESLHGKTGNPTNEIIFSVLDRAASPRDIAFILGYITHCALDITLHPLVYYLSGNYYDPEPAKKQHAVYLHRHIETCLDGYLGNSLRIYDLVRTSLLGGLVFEEIIGHDFSVSAEDMLRSLRKQLHSNRLFTSTLAYRLARMLFSCGIMKDYGYLGLFYGDVAAQGSCISDPFTYRDIISGAPRTSSVKDLMKEAREKALGMMEAAYGYSRGTITKERLKEMIPGESLDTGRVLVATSAIRHTDADREQTGT